MPLQQRHFVLRPSGFGLLSAFGLRVSGFAPQ
jgi:hypothetical protein